MSNPSAKVPFHFISCMELRESLGKRTQDTHRLLEIIEEVPADSIYYHTHSYYLRHPYTQELYPNDFATWVVRHAQDRVLGERLGVVDPFEFDDVEALRAELVGIIGDHLPLMDELGVKTRWEVFMGTELFYRTTKNFHNALQGTKQRFTKDMFDAYIECNRENAKRLNLDADVALIHDPQPGSRPRSFMGKRDTPSILPRGQLSILDTSSTTPNSWPQ